MNPLPPKQHHSNERHILDHFPCVGNHKTIFEDGESLLHKRQSKEDEDEDQEEGKDESYGIRVEVKGGGCSGLSYDLGFDNAEKPGDHVFEHNGITTKLGQQQRQDGS